MSEPSNDEVADALEKLAEGDVAPSSEEPAAVTIEPAADSQDDRPPLPATFPGAVPSASAIPDEIIADDPPVEESDDIEMTEPATGEPSESPVLRTPTVTLHRPPLYQTMEFRRTIIPILLTCAILTLGFSSLKFAMGPDSIFSDLPMWLPITLMSAGVILLFLAVLNMLAVKHAR